MIEALSEALLNSLWRGAALTALAACLLRLTNRWTTPSERYGVWLATLAVIVAAPFVEVFDELAVVAPLGAPMHEASSSVALPAMPAPPVQAAAEIEVAPWLGPLMIGVWPLGAAALLILLAVRLRIAMALKRNSRRLPPEWISLVAAWSGVQSPGRLGETRSSADACTPLAVGWFRPVVLLPDGLSRRPAADDLHGLWLHEQAHVRRYDDWTQLLVAAASAVFWFHPAVHWIRARLDAEREAACDAAVVEAGVAPEQYARALTRLAESVASARPAVALGAAGRRSQLFRRVEMLMSDSRKSRRSSGRSAFAFAAIVAAALLSWSSSSAPRAVLAQALPPPTPTAPAPTPHPAPVPQAPMAQAAPAPQPAPKPSPVPPAAAQAPAVPQPPVAPVPPDMRALHEDMERFHVEMQPHIEEIERLAREIETIVEENIAPHREAIEKLSVEISKRVEAELEPLHEELAARAEELAKRHSEMTADQVREIELKMREVERRMHEQQGPIHEMEQKLHKIQREHIREAETQVREVQRRMLQEQRELREVERKMQREKQEREEQGSKETEPLLEI